MGICCSSVSVWLSESLSSTCSEAVLLRSCVFFTSDKEVEEGS